MTTDPRPLPASLSLEGKRGLIIGIANDRSIAWGCARACHQLGAELAITYLDDHALPHVAPLADQVGCELLMPLNVRDEHQMETLFETLTDRWGRLDFVLHSIAYAPAEDLKGRLVDCSREGFNDAMTVSCHSFLALCRLAEPLMTEGGTLFTMTYHGSQKVVEGYHVMGPVKAALEAATRYMAAELGPKGIRVHALSPGPMKTRAASGLSRFDDLLQKAQERSPSSSLPDVDDVGMTMAYLATDAARMLTGDALYVDGGVHLIS
ncbi:enoyl-ACP reductase FabI [Larsenimonas rhizosphaerae]|uniref:Enoyl-[acyl-carrier-protein] reductase [NADH] n=1 Tax=Larsenimonas rhizosphaerae TaxID=2944682 RepID=A0AA41ZEG6_9GAMM|nr:enoyl-ACP reductase FabI [Larsenimonas rhizosphaerae]MCM2130296.1 enoyl-ACP reductase FabI [Larsenimonas rhizosphaerae]MCX2523000.1 enoyl-ACP reductase FabI [Larsenimonas rhizosphaerae]